MHLFTLPTYTLAFAPYALGYSFNKQGQVSSFAATNLTTGFEIVSEVYDNCAVRNATGFQYGIGAPCVEKLLQYVFVALAGAGGGDLAVATAESGQGGVQIQDDKRSIDGKRLTPDIINQALSHQFLGRSVISATAVIDSDIHDKDGYAVKYDVHGNNSTPHVHTNVSHSMALFEPSNAINERDFLPTNGDYFDFGNVAGVKITAHEINGSLSNTNYLSDLTNSIFLFGAGNNSATVTFERSDKWLYVVCDDEQRPLFFGLIIAEQEEPGRNYEIVNPPTCAAPINIPTTSVLVSSPMTVSSLTTQTESSLVTSSGTSLPTTGFSPHGSSLYQTNHESSATDGASTGGDTLRLSSLSSLSSVSTLSTTSTKSLSTVPFSTYTDPATSIKSPQSTTALSEASTIQGTGGRETAATCLCTAI